MRILLGLFVALALFALSHVFFNFIQSMAGASSGFYEQFRPIATFIIPAFFSVGISRTRRNILHRQEFMLGSGLGLILLSIAGFIHNAFLLRPLLQTSNQSLFALFNPLLGIGLLIALTTGLGLLVLSRLGPGKTKSGRLKPERADAAVFGDADWMRMEDAATLFPAGPGIVLGERYRVDEDKTAKSNFAPTDKATWGLGGKAPLLSFNGQFGSTHGLVFAGSGGFKTTGIVIPTALSWPGSTVVLDPSREVGPMVSESRELQGRDVYSLDPKQPEFGFNVLDWIRHSDSKAEHLASTASWLLKETKTETDTGSFFKSNTHKLLTGILADIMLSGTTPEPLQNLKTMRQIIALPENKLREHLEQIYETSPVAFVRETVSSFIEMAEQTFSGVAATAATETQWLSFPNYAPLVTGDYFSTEELRSGNCDVFINLDLKTLDDYPGIARVIIGALMNSIYEADGDVKGRTLFMLDEAARLGHMKIIKTARDAGRKYGITLLMIYQSIGQVKEIWGQNAQSDWFESTSFRSFAALSDPTTAELVSKMCGEYTVSIRNKDHTKGYSSGGAFSGKYSGNKQDRTQTQKRRLILPHELLQDMRPDEQIILTSGNRPLRCGRPIYFRRKAMLAAVGENRFHDQNKSSDENDGQ